MRTTTDFHKQAGQQVILFFIILECLTFKEVSKNVFKKIQFFPKPSLQFDVLTSRDKYGPYSKVQDIITTKHSLLYTRFGLPDTEG